MDNQPHIGLVDTHSEGVRCRNRAELTIGESLLHVLFRVRRQASVEMSGRNILTLADIPPCPHSAGASRSRR